MIEMQKEKPGALCIGLFSSSLIYCFHTDIAAIRPHRWVLLRQPEMHFGDGKEIAEQVFRDALADVLQQLGGGLHFFLQYGVYIGIAHCAGQVIGLCGKGEVGLQLHIDCEAGADHRLLRVHTVAGKVAAAFNVDVHGCRFHALPGEVIHNVKHRKSCR